MVWPLSDRRVIVRCGLSGHRALWRRVPGRGETDQRERRDTRPHGGQPARPGGARGGTGLHLAAPVGHADQGTGPRIPHPEAGRGASPDRLRGLETTYRLFGLLPDTLHLRALLVDLYSEQVAGFYDPDSATLFGVEGSDPDRLRLVLAHEMIHALQGQHLRLDSILDDRRNNDRLSAAQAILEGQATLASLDVLAPGQDVAQNPQFWELYRDQVRQQQTSMPVFREAPLILRESLIFPYLQGAEFMHWWAESPFRDTLPYGRRMPQSTEQILHPERYARATCRWRSRIRRSRMSCTRMSWGRTRSGSCWRIWPAPMKCRPSCPWVGAEIDSVSTRPPADLRWSGT